MKKTLFFIIICLLTVSLYAQGDRIVDSVGNLIYQYNRTANYYAPGQCKVTVTFVNGRQQLGISFRQEVFKSQVEWTDIDHGDTSKPQNIEIITANLAPNESVAWSYIYKNKHCRKDKAVDLERAGFMILDKDFVVTKKIIPEKSVKEK